MPKSTAPRLRRPPRQLSDKALRFAHEYTVDLNATKAAERAGYSKRTAKMAGSRLMTNDDVLRLIQKQAIRHLRRVDLRAEDVLRRIMMAAVGDVRRLVGENGRLRPIQELEDDVEVLIAGMKVGDDGVVELKVIDRLKALGLLAQHFDLLKSKLDVHHTGSVGLLEEETLRHMSDANLAKLKAASDVISNLMGG